MKSLFVPELGRYLYGELVDIWNLQHPTKSRRDQESIRSLWLRHANSKQPKVELVSVTPWTIPTVTPTSSRLVITVAIGKQSQAEAAYTIPRMKDYASRCGADFVAITESSGQAWPMAEKWRVSDYARHYERTLYIDADVWIADGSPDLFSVHRDGLWMANDLNYLSDDLRWAEFELKQICESQGIDVPFDWQVMHNSGVWIGDRESFDLYRPPEKPFPSFHCAEQFWQQVCYERSGKKVNELDPRFNWEFIGPRFWEGIRDAHFIHLNGVRPQLWRTRILERIAKGNFAQPQIPSPRSSGQDAWRPSWWVKADIDETCANCIHWGDEKSPALAMVHGFRSIDRVALCVIHDTLTKQCSSCDAIQFDD